MPSISVTPVEGSISENVASNFGAKNIVSTALNGLSNGASTTALAYDNPAGVSACDVIISLAPIDMVSSGTIRIDDGTNYQELAVPSGNSGKRCLFLEVDASFLANFTIYNGTGVALSSSGNIVTIVPRY